MSASTWNPSHLLISRNSRSPAHPQLVSSPLYAQTPTPGPHLFSFSASSNTTPEPQHADDAPESDTDDDDGLVVHPTFRRDAALPGRVCVYVGRHEFWCHKEVLWFSSPFFQALLEGDWTETSATVPDTASISVASVLSSSPTDTDVFPPKADTAVHEETETLLDPATAGSGDDSTAKDSVYLDAMESPSVAEILKELREIPDPATRPDSGPRLDEDQVTTQTEHQAAENQAALAREANPDQKQRPADTGAAQPPQRTKHHDSKRTRPRRPSNVDAVVNMKEDSASAFQDFLFWAYPHLECKVTWTNVAGLLALASKLIVPALQSLCERFLMTHASGRPIIALALAEQHNNSELYREASRFVLDQASWDEEELETLSERTKLKLSQRRTWFLERLLKLGSIDVNKEYTCRPDCPDPSRCSAQLDDKWRQATSAVSRYGPPQPSVAFRCLRQLETFPTNPSLVMPHPLCQSTAKSWIASLFDRMFQPKMAFSSVMPGTDKYWLYITM